MGPEVLIDQRVELPRRNTCKRLKPTIMIKNLTPITLSLIIILANSSCTREPGLPPAGESNRIFKIQLHSSYLQGDKVDSAVATWTVNGRQQRVFLTRSADTLVGELKKFDAGSGQIEVEIVSSKKFSSFYSSRWYLRKQATITLTDNFTLEGPEGFNDTQWKPRVELKDNIGHFAIVARRPDDSYFFIKDVPVGIQKVILARDYWKLGGGVFRVGGGEWQCSTNCTDGNNNIENTHFFSFLPAQIGSSAWNHIEISVLYAQDQWGGGPVLNFTETL